VAVFAYFWHDILKITTGFIITTLSWFTKSPVDKAHRENSFLGWLIIAGTIPVGIFGLVFRKYIEGKLTKDLRVIAASLIGLAILLAIAELVGKQKRSIKEVGLKDALFAGTAQVLALVPGSSRSGTTMTGGLFSRSSSPILLPSVDPRDHSKRPSRAAEGPIIGPDRMGATRGGYCGLRGRRLPVDSVSAPVPAEALYLFIHRLQDCAWTGDHRIARVRQDSSLSQFEQANRGKRQSVAAGPELQLAEPGGKSSSQTALWGFHLDPDTSSIDQFNPPQDPVFRYRNVVRGCRIASCDERAFGGRAIDPDYPMNDRGVISALVQNDVASLKEAVLNRFNSDEIAIFDARAHTAAAHSDLYRDAA
jgi:hypothetical protein